MKDTPKPDNRRMYDAAFRAEALRLAEQSRSAQAAARACALQPKAYTPRTTDSTHGLRCAPTGCSNAPPGRLKTFKS